MPKNLIVRMRAAMRKARLARHPQRVRDIQPAITWLNRHAEVNS